MQASFGQKITGAIFTTCKGEEDPYGCTTEKFEADITKLISKKIRKEIRKTVDSAYFSVSIAFLSDGTGKVLHETVKVECDIPTVNAEVKDYLTSLPAFYPKNTDDGEPRTAHILDYTFVFNHKTGKYYSTSKDDLRILGIKPDNVMIATPPLLQECADKSNAYECTVSKISKIAQNSYQVPDFTGPDRTVKMLATYIIEKDGRLNIKEINCSDVDQVMMTEEFRRVLNSLPAFIPANYLGVFVRTSFTLPLALTLAN